MILLFTLLFGVRSDTAINAATNHLVEGAGDKAATLNQLGVAYYLKGEMPKGALNFQHAIDLRPEDKQLQNNLDMALEKMGKGERQPAQRVASTMTAGGVRARSRKWGWTISIGWSKGEVRGRRRTLANDSAIWSEGPGAPLTETAISPTALATCYTRFGHGAPDPLTAAVAESRMKLMLEAPRTRQLNLSGMVVDLETLSFRPGMNETSRA